MRIFSLFKPRVPTSSVNVGRRLLEVLQEIGQIKNNLPLNQRGWCNELGLFVQLREAMGMARLQAGGKYRSQLDAWRDSLGEPWRIKKYNPGNWERLVDPTLQLTRWLGDRQGLPGGVEGDFHSSIRMFQTTDVLHLPQDYLSIGVKTELGQMVNAIRVHNVVDFLPKIRDYVARHGGDATAWDCLRSVCHLAGEHRQALDASLRAAELAPYDGVIRYAAATIYFTALANELRRRRGLDHSTGADIKGCTLEALGVTYEEARTATWYHLRAAIDSSITGDHRKAAEMMAKFLQQ